MTQDSFIRLSNVNGMEVLHIPPECGENAKNEPSVEEIRCFGTHVTLFFNLLHVQLPWVLEILYICLWIISLIYIYNWNWSYILLLPPFLWYIACISIVHIFHIEIRPLLPQGFGHRGAAVFVCRLAHLNHGEVWWRYPEAMHCYYCCYSLQKDMFFVYCK